MSICTDKTLANICYCSKEIKTSASLTLWYPKHHHEDFHQCTLQATVGRHYFLQVFTSIIWCQVFISGSTLLRTFTLQVNHNYACTHYGILHVPV